MTNQTNTTFPANHGEIMLAEAKALNALHAYKAALRVMDACLPQDVTEEIIAAVNAAAVIAKQMQDKYAALVAVVPAPVKPTLNWVADEMGIEVAVTEDVEYRVMNACGMSLYGPKAVAFAEGDAAPGFLGTYNTLAEAKRVCEDAAAAGIFNVSDR